MIKQRFVGFVVLVAIAVIFWPVVFITPENADDFQLPALEMPPKPTIEVSERREPTLNKVDQAELPKVPKRPPPISQPGDIVSPSPNMVLIGADDEPDQQWSALERAEFDDQGLPVSWELQIATFSNVERAGKISQLLRDKGHKAYVSPIILDDQRLFRVMIGPKLQKQRLIEIQPAINDYFSVESFIVRFTPI